MDKSIDIAQQALADPPEQLRDLDLSSVTSASVAQPAAAAAAQPPTTATAPAGADTPSNKAKQKTNSDVAIGEGLDAKLQVGQLFPLLLPTHTPGPLASLTPTRPAVDENQQFTAALDKHMQGWQLAHAGFNYDVVAVFGSQSTGKSTLLNKLFGTRFDVMSETERRQTTKGIWMSKGSDMDVLVMDVEGTDGRERGEDQDFERKSALFSMAVAEVLIVNIWEHQVGLYQGANMGLLKTVFEVNLGLFLAAKQNGKSEGR